MARKRGTNWRDEAASALIVKALSRVELAGNVLVMLESRGDVEEAVRAGGASPSVWHRTAGEGIRATSWPEGGPYTAATLRIPRAKDAFEMAVHAAAAVLEVGGRLWVYGANDEGAGSAEGRLREILGSGSTIASGGRCRVLESRRPKDVPGLLNSLGAWKSTFAIEGASLGIPELPAVWTSFPGVFAQGRVDAGTRALMEALPRVPPGSSVLDFACGSGLIGWLVQRRQPETTVDFLDADAVALKAVEVNVPGARTILSDGFAGVGEERYDMIVSNPPYHEGKDETGRALEELAGRAPSYLRSKGTLVLVTQRRLPVRPHLEAAFRRVEVLSDDGPHRVWRADL